MFHHDPHHRHPLDFGPPNFPPPRRESHGSNNPAVPCDRKLGSEAAVGNGGLVGWLVGALLKAVGCVDGNLLKEDHARTWIRGE